MQNIATKVFSEKARIENAYRENIEYIQLAPQRFGTGKNMSTNCDVIKAKFWSIVIGIKNGVLNCRKSDDEVEKKVKCDLVQCGTEMEETLQQMFEKILDGDEKKESVPELSQLQKLSKQLWKKQKIQK